MALNIFRLHIESIAMYLASCSNRACAEAEAEGANPRIVAGVRAARDVFAEKVTETDADQLHDQMLAEIRKDLAELDKTRGVSGKTDEA